MKIRTLGFLSGLLMLVPLLAAGQTSSRIDDLKWLTGSWRVDEGSTVIEEQWNAPSGGLMLATGRRVSEDRAAR